MTNPPIARYQQVAGQLRAEIRSGIYAPGEALPSESTLAERFNLNRTTINKAVRQLVAQGLVRVEHGRGAFVRDQSPAYELEPGEHLDLVLQRRDGRVDVVRGIVSGAPLLAGQRALIVEMCDVVDIEHRSAE